MKTSTEYRKRKHMISQVEDTQTEEIELRKLRKLQTKSSNTDMNKHTKQLSSIKFLMILIKANCHAILILKII